MTGAEGHSNVRGHRFTIISSKQYQSRTTSN